MRSYESFCNGLKKWIVLKHPDLRSNEFTQRLAVEYMDYVLEGNNATKNGKALCFDENQARVIGRTARGVKAIKLIGDDYVVGASAVSDDKIIITISETGLGKVAKPEEYQMHSRATQGQMNYKVAKYGKVVSVLCADYDDDLLIITANGMTVRFPIDSIAIHSKASKGVKIINLADGDSIISAVAIAKISEDELSEDETEAAETSAETSSQEQIENTGNENNE
jgi:DNA gyrase subunit A